VVSRHLGDLIAGGSVWTGFCVPGWVSLIYFCEYGVKFRASL
jgi:hypothetical protein